MKVKIGKPKTNRKVEVWVADYDTWSLDNTLAKIIYPSLVAFKKARKKVPGVPLSFFNDNDPVDEHGNHTDASHDVANVRFEEALDKMIWAFREIADDKPGESQFFLKNGKKWKTKKIKSGKKHFGSEIIETGLEIDREGLNQYEKKIVEGIELFGKHFQSLWW